jgi:rhodanese-related sulfurtransferase
MSTAAAQTLVRLGYTNVWHLEGGFIAWEQAGFPLIRR